MIKYSKSRYFFKWYIYEKLKKKKTRKTFSCLRENSKILKFYEKIEVSDIEISVSISNLLCTVLLTRYFRLLGITFYVMIL